jgi:hypothetical protein
MTIALDDQLMPTTRRCSHSQNPDLVSPSDIDGFMEAWAELDPEANNKLPESALPELIAKVPPPLGTFGEDDAANSAKSIAKKLKVEKPGGLVKFADVLLALSLKRYVVPPH